MEKVFNPCCVVLILWGVDKSGVATAGMSSSLQNQIVFIRHSDQGCVKVEEALRSEPDSRDPSRPPFDADKADRSLPLVPLSFVP